MDLFALCVLTSILSAAAHAQFTFINVADTTTAAPVGTFSSFGGFGVYPSISGGTTAFSAFYNSGSNQGIFLSAGGTLTNVILQGDTLFGSTLLTLEFNRFGLDDTGTGYLAFQYSLANGRNGIAIARTSISSTPEPGSLMLLVGMGVAAAEFTLRRRRC